jgi:hypothetical protein
MTRFILFALFGPGTWVALAISLTQAQQVDNRCRAKHFKCEMRCNEDTKGGTMARMKCYDRCREDEQDCRKYGDDGP